MTEKHFVEVENGEKVAAVHHEADSDKWVFFCHGFGSNKEGSYRERCERFAEEGFNAVRFDFRGNGESDGDFIEQTLSSRIKDLKAVVEYFDPSRYGLFSSSFGGKVVFHATELDPDFVLGKAPVTYSEIMEKFKAVVEEKGRFEYIDGKPIDDRFIDDLYSYSFSEVEKSVEVPVAIFHGAEDTTVHPRHSFRAAENLDTGVMLQKLEGEQHSFSEEGEKYMREGMISWLRNNNF